MGKPVQDAECAIDPVANNNFIFPGLDVDVGCPHSRRLLNDLVCELDKRGDSAARSCASSISEIEA